ncbi:MAG: DUF4097 family beta strand repeat-containing protein [Lachnospirales bacterium]
MSNLRDNFIDGLKKELGHLPYSEVEKIVSFFEESIEDKLDDGISEEDIFSVFGSYEDVAKEILEDYDSSKRKTDFDFDIQKKEKTLKEYTFDETFENILLNDINSHIIVKPSTDDKIHLKVYENKNKFYEVTTNSSLEIICIEKPEFFFKNITFNFKNDYDLTELYIPMNSSNTNLKVKNKNGDIKLSDLVLKNLESNLKNGNLHTSTLKLKSANLDLMNGNIVINNFYSKKTNIKNMNGKIEICENTSGDFSVSNINGSIILNCSTSENLSIKNINGTINLDDVLSKSFIHLENVNGKITFNDIRYITYMDIKCTHGNVKGNLPFKEDEISFDLVSTFGNIKLNDSKTGNLKTKAVGDLSFKCFNSFGNIKVTTL